MSTYKTITAKVWTDENYEDVIDATAVIEDAIHDDAPNDEWFFLDLPRGGTSAYLRRADVLAFLTGGAA